MVREMLSNFLGPPVYSFYTIILLGFSKILFLDEA